MTAATLAATAMFGTFASAADAQSRQSAISPTIISNVVDIAVCLLVKVCPVNGGNQQRAVMCKDGTPAAYGGSCSAYQQRDSYAQPQGDAPTPVKASPPPQQ